MSPLIEVAAIAALPTDNVVIVDARSGPDSYERYLQGHLPGAVFIDLDKDLAKLPQDAAYGGRHPLPDIQAFAALLGRLCIGKETHVIVYDDKAAANPAARFWWMLHAVGHKNVQVLNGGLQAAIAAGLALSTEAALAKELEPYPVPEAFTGTVDLEEAGKAAQDESRVVIDVRETARYLGQTEPIDLIAGHIPGAVNIPFVNNMGPDNRYLPADELQSAYTAALGAVNPENVIVHCGSGVTACHTLLALEHAGIKGAKLYVGSWSEWSRRDLPIATNER
ncbi:sulfurtransferase [Mucilaginibacter sp. Bleaf8]|uniref:sulfurtransferase n=1 Tax=Mucilaginibacter sp. Bleaf8 TaxID=2834430 RepID=UPI001BCDBB1D|nr:sulfurtransferase [Mucilaginibacter sp. Bleaf8]MBS7564055.1 sulfurtransferase [Mucilaginibacter sp. Bleaf8]